MAFSITATVKALSSILISNSSSLRALKSRILRHFNFEREIFESFQAINSQILKTSCFCSQSVYSILKSSSFPIFTRPCVNILIIKIQVQKMSEDIATLEELRLVTSLAEVSLVGEIKLITNGNPVLLARTRKQLIIFLLCDFVVASSPPSTAFLSDTPRRT